MCRNIACLLFSAPMNFDGYDCRRHRSKRDARRCDISSYAVRTKNTQQRIKKRRCLILYYVRRQRRHVMMSTRHTAVRSFAEARNDATRCARRAMSKRQWRKKQNDIMLLIFCRRRFFFFFFRHATTPLDADRCLIRFAAVIAARPQQNASKTQNAIQNRLLSFDDIFFRPRGAL